VCLYTFSFSWEFQWHMWPDCTWTCICTCFVFSWFFLNLEYQCILQTIWEHKPHLPNFAPFQSTKHHARYTLCPC
jgi:hypothetical protein